MRDLAKALSLALLFVFPAALAHGQGVISLPKTGQTSCWSDAGASIPCAGTGQDGDIQAGVDWPSPRFTKSGRCYTDELTGLMWVNYYPVFPIPGGSWAVAVDYANSLEMCGYSDWRLANANEILSQANAQEVNTYAWLYDMGITFGINGISSTTYAGNPTLTAFDSSFVPVTLTFKGKTDASLDKIICVRGGQQNSADSTYPANVWKTGQTASYATGDDGDLEWGVAWPTPRFTDNGNQTVTDNLTGLVWTKAANTPGPAACSPGVQKKWQALLDHVKCLNANNYLGFTGWRLPNRIEMRSLLDFSHSGPALPTGHPFTDVQPTYVTSTTMRNSTNRYAWEVSIHAGIQTGLAYAKNIHNTWGWPVRDDTGAPPCTDVDGDGYGDPGSSSCSNGSETDCDDGDDTIYPGATESCNGDDDDCDGSVDEGYNIGSACSVGQGECLANGLRICSGDGSTWVCDATPGTPQAEICDDLDNDCDGTSDEGNPGGGGACSTGLPGVCDAGTMTCTGGALVCEQDTLPSSEVCNGQDDDCDGSVDEGAIDATTWYRDADGDGYGDANDSVVSCTQPPGYVADDQDCDDGDDQILLCNTPVSPTPVVIEDPSGDASLEFPDVITEGFTTVGEVPCTMNEPDGFTLNTSATCYEIETTADSSTGAKIVCIRYPDSLDPTPTYLFQCQSSGVSNCCAIPLSGGSTSCPAGTPAPFPAFQSQSVVPPDQLEICITTYHLSHFGFGELNDATDTDFDSVPDVVDNCPLTFNPLQEDADFDGMGNACDPPEVDDTGASDVFLTPGCYPGCQPSDFPIDWGVFHTFEYSLPGDEEIAEVIISGTWGDVDNFDSSAPAEIFLDGVPVAECIEGALCWQTDGQFVDWSFSFLAAGVPDLEGLFRDGEAELTATQNDEISLILSNLQLQIYTRPIQSNPVPSISAGGLALLVGLVLGIVSWAQWRR